MFLSWQPFRSGLHFRLFHSFVNGSSTVLPILPCPHQAKKALSMCTDCTTLLPLAVTVIFPPSATPDTVMHPGVFFYFACLLLGFH